MLMMKLLTTDIVSRLSLQACFIAQVSQITDSYLVNLKALLARLCHINGSHVQNIYESPYISKNRAYP